MADRPRRLAAAPSRRAVGGTQGAAATATVVVRSTVPVHLRGADPVGFPALDGSPVPLACAAVGTLLTLTLLQAGAAALVPLWTLWLGALPFHAGAGAALRGIARGRRGSWAGLACNALPAALFWLGTFSLAAFARQLAA